MFGHASSSEIEMVKQMERSLDLARSPIDELLRLGQLYIEPLHQEHQAIKVLEAAIRREPCNTWVTYWLSYCCVYYLMDDSALEKARDLLKSCILTCPKPSAAIYSLLAEVLDDLEGPWRQDVKSEQARRTPTPLVERIHLLEESVRLEPSWVNNRISLAWAYERAGRIGDAIHELEQAKKNIVHPDANWDYTRRNFEELVTGRIAHNVKERIDEKLMSLKD